MTTHQKINGDQAFAMGAIASGVKFVYSYPGSPSSATVDCMIHAARANDIYVEWSANEKVAIEKAIGASIAGYRSLVCVKSVGFNLTLDPLMTLNLTPVNGGLIILLGDDPGGYGSQNDQDTRPLSMTIEIPMLEACHVKDGYQMIMDAYQLSEQLRTPIIIRETRGLTQQIQEVELSENIYNQNEARLEREPWRYVPVPKNVVAKHKELHKKNAQFTEWIESCSYNSFSKNNPKGIICAGFTYSKAIDLLADNVGPDSYDLFKLSSVFPIPKSKIVSFLNWHSDILLLEETEPYLETQIKAIAFDNGCSCKIKGRLDGFNQYREGELYRWQIQELLQHFDKAYLPLDRFSRENVHNELPEMVSYCKECGYDRIFEVLSDTAKSNNQNPLWIGDPGCLVTIADRLDAKYAIGSATAVADGICKAKTGERAIAIFGDSAFFHTAIPAIINAVVSQSDIIIVVLDNGVAKTSGNQPHPGVGVNSLGECIPKMEMEDIVKACQVPNIHRVGQENILVTLREVFSTCLSQPEMAFIHVML